MADIGTDHAYIPIKLTQDNKIVKAIACDIKEGPLSIAKKNVDKYGFSDIIELRLGAGLEPLSKNEVESVVIAGMGGENIASILEAAPWTADGKHTLLLSPHTKAEELRNYLMEHGYEICREALVYDRGTI